MERMERTAAAVAWDRRIRIIRRRAGMVETEEMVRMEATVEMAGTHHLCKCW